VLLSVAIVLTNNYSYASTLFGNKSHAQRFLEDEASGKEKAFECLRLTVPPEFGSVIQYHKGREEGLIVLIQDRHADEIAQLNIANIIDTMEDNYNIELLCLEGASDRLDTSFYDNIPDTKAKEITSRFYVHEGLFTGAEYYKISNKDKEIAAYGVEDKDLYFKHAAAYKKHSANTEEMGFYLQTLSRSLDTLKPHILSEPLKLIDNKEQAYEDKQISLGEFVTYITKEAIGKDIQLSAYPNLEVFSQAVSIEKIIDFEKAESRRDDLVKALSSMLKDDALNTLLKNSLDFKLNKISASAYYEYIEDIVNQNKDSINKVSYKQLFAYIDYIKLSDKVDNIVLFDEIDSALKNIKTLHYTNDTERLFDDYLRYIELSSELYDLKLTEKNVDELGVIRKAVNMSQVVSFINKQSKRYNINSNIANPPADNEAFKNALDYYELALKRDIALISNTLRRMAVSGKDSSMLVAGGFHTQGIVNILKRFDISYIVVCPKIGSGDCEEIYQRQMNNQMPSTDAILNFMSNMLAHTLYTGKEMAGTVAPRVEEHFLPCMKLVKEVLSNKAKQAVKPSSSGTDDQLELSNNELVLDKSTVTLLQPTILTTEERKQIETDETEKIEPVPFRKKIKNLLNIKIDSFVLTLLILSGIAFAPFGQVQQSAAEIQNIVFQQEDSKGSKTDFEKIITIKSNDARSEDLQRLVKTLVGRRALEPEQSKVIFQENAVEISISYHTIPEEDIYVYVSSKYFDCPFFTIVTDKNGNLKQEVEEIFKIHGIPSKFVSVELEGIKHPLIKIIKDVFELPEVTNEIREEAVQEMSSLQQKLREEREQMSRERISIHAESKAARNQRTSKWWEEHRYIDSDFLEKNKGLIGKVNSLPRLTLAELLEIIEPKDRLFPHFIGLPMDIPPSLKLTGRLGYAETRDKNYYEMAKQSIAELGDSFKDALMINYTGHQAPVGAAIAEHNIPIYWQMTANQRILNAIKDYYPYFKNNTLQNHYNNYSVLLEAPHSPADVISISLLPNAKQLQDLGISQIILFTENISGKKYTLSDLSMTNVRPEFIDYLEELYVNGIKPIIIGLEKSSSSGTVLENSNIGESLTIQDLPKASSSGDTLNTGKLLSLPIIKEEKESSLSVKTEEGLEKQGKALLSGVEASKENGEAEKTFLEKLFNRFRKKKALDEKLGKRVSSESTWVPFKPQNSETVKESQGAFEYSDPKQDFLGVSLEHFVWAQNRLAEQNLSAAVLKKVLSALGIKKRLSEKAAYQKIYQKATEIGYTKRVIDLINSETYQDPRLRIEIIGQNKNPRSQGILEAISNGLDALGLEIGQFGKGVKQIIDWLEPTGADRIDVFTKEKQGLSYQLVIFKDTQGQNYIQIKTISLQAFQKVCGQAAEQGTVLKVTTKDKIPLADEEFDGQRRNSQEGIVKAVHKRFPYVTAVEVTTQIENKKPQKVNGFENKRVIVPSKATVYTQEEIVGNIDIQLSGHTVKIIDNGRGMAAGILSRMFVPGRGTKYQVESLSGEAAQKELSNVKVVEDITLPHRVSFSRNGEVVEAIDIPEDIVKDATVEGGLMIELSSLLDVPESRDNIIIPLELKPGEKPNFQLAIEHAVTEIIGHPVLSDVDKIRYINTIIIGLEGLTQGNENYAHTIKAICANTQKLLVGTISSLRKENFVILPHDKTFKKLTIPEGKEALFVSKNLFNWQGALSLEEIGAVIVPGISLDGDKDLRLVLVPFTEESLKGVLKYHPGWHTWQQDGRLPIIRTDRFIAIPSNLSGSQRLSELTVKRVKGLTQDEEKELASLLQIVNIITAEQVVTSYEVTKPKENLKLVSRIELVKSEGKIDSEAVNKFLVTLPVSAQASGTVVDSPPIDANQRHVVVNGDLVEVGTGVKVLFEKTGSSDLKRALDMAGHIEKAEPLANGYYKITTRADSVPTCYRLVKIEGDCLENIFSVWRSEGEILFSPDKQFAYTQKKDGTVGGKIYDLEMQRTYYLGSDFSTINMILPLQSPYSDIQFSKGGNYLTYIKEDEKTANKELVVIRIATAEAKRMVPDDPLSFKSFDFKGGEEIGCINLGKGNIEYAINPFANVAFLRDKDSALVSLVDLEIGSCFGNNWANNKIKHLHTDSTGTYTVIVDSKGEMDIYLHKAKMMLTHTRFGRLESVFTGWDKEGNKIFGVSDEMFPWDGEYFTEDGKEIDLSDIYSADYSFESFSFEGKQMLWGSDTTLHSEITSVDAFQRLDKKGVYKHPYFNLFIDNSDPNHPVAIDSKTGEMFAYQGEIVGYTETKDALENKKSLLIVKVDWGVAKGGLVGLYSTKHSGYLSLLDSVVGVSANFAIGIKSGDFTICDFSDSSTKPVFNDNFYKSITPQVYSSVTFDGKYFVFLNPKTGDVVYLDPSKPEDPIFVSAQEPINAGEKEIFSESLLAANEIIGSFEKAKALGSISLAIAQSGDTTQAETIFTQALNIARNEITAPPTQKALVLASIALTAAQSGDTSQSETIFTQALNIVRNEITEPSHKVRALVFIAQAVAVAQSGDTSQSETIFTQALNVARDEITDPFWKSEELAFIAQAVVQSGDTSQSEIIFTQALDIARNEIIESSQKIKALVSIVEVVAQSGDITQALDIARDEITDLFWKAKALVFIVQAMAQSGDITQALDIARNEITDSDWKAEALTSVAQVIAKSGDTLQAETIFTQALNIARNEITDSSQEEEALAAIVQAMAQSGDITQALDIARNEMIDPYKGEKALASIAQAVAQSGDITQALDIARNEITDSVQRREVLFSIVQAVAQAYHGKQKEALVVSETEQIEVQEEALELWHKDIQPRRDEFIVQARTAYEPFLELIPEEYQGEIERTAKLYITKLYEEQEKEIMKRYKDALKGKPLELDASLPFDTFSERMHQIMDILPGYLNSIAGLLAQEEYSTQKGFYFALFRKSFELSGNLEIKLGVIDKSIFEVLGHRWDINTQEKVNAMSSIARFIQNIKVATHNQIKLSEITNIVQFLSYAASLDNGKNIRIIKRQLSKILGAKEGVKRKFLERLHQVFKALDFDDILSYIENPDKPHKLGEARAFIVFLTNDVEQIKIRRRFVPKGVDFTLTKRGIGLSQIIELERQRFKAKASEKDIVMDIEYLLEHIHSLPESSYPLEDKLLKDITVQSESGGYTREITQNSGDAESSELVIDFYLQSNERGEDEYVERAVDNGTGALKEVALLIPKSTKAKGGQIELSGFFGTGKYTIFEGVDRLELITKNQDRAYMFSFTVIKDASGKAKAIKLTGIRKVDDESVKQGVTVCRIKTIDNTIPELDAMLSQRAWKTFAGLAQNENFTIYFIDYEGNKQPLLVEKELLAQSDFITVEPAEDKPVNFGKFKIISAKDMPLQVVDKAGLRVCSLKEEYLELVPASLRKHIKELGIVIQIPLPLIRNRTAFEHEDEYLPIIQKYVAIEFYKAIAYKTLTQTDPQFVFEGFPLDWETNDSYWNAIDLNDKGLVELADRINKNKYAEIEGWQLKNLLTDPGRLDKEKKALKLLLLLEIAKDAAQPGQGDSLLLHRLAIQQEINAAKVKAQSETLKNAGLTVGIIPRPNKIPHYQQKLIQAQGIETARQQMMEPERYIIPQDKYTSLERKLVVLANSLVRHIGIEQVSLVGNVQFAGAFKRYQGKSTMFLNRSLANGIGEKGAGAIDEATDTIIHELAHLLEELMRQDNVVELLKKGYVAHLADFTHDTVGTFAEAMKYVAAISLASHVSELPIQSPATAKAQEESAALFLDDTSKASSSGDNVLESSNIRETLTIQDAVAASSTGAIERTSSSGTGMYQQNSHFPKTHFLNPESKVKFHGTPFFNLVSILQEGLLPPGSGFAASPYASHNGELGVISFYDPYHLSVRYVKDRDPSRWPSRHFVFNDKKIGLIISDEIHGIQAANNPKTDKGFYDETYTNQAIRPEMIQGLIVSDIMANRKIKDLGDTLDFKLIHMADVLLNAVATISIAEEHRDRVVNLIERDKLRQAADLLFSILAKQLEEQLEILDRDILVKDYLGYLSKIYTLPIYDHYGNELLITESHSAYSDPLMVERSEERETEQIESSNDTIERTSSGGIKGVTRRDFLKTIGALTAGAIIASQAKPVIAFVKSTQELDSYPVSLNHLYNLSKKQGIKYIKGFYAEIEVGRMGRDKAEAFLRQVFKEEDILWMKAEAIKALIKLGMVSKGELKMHIYAIPDLPILKGITSALGEVGTKEAVNHLIEWSKTETDKGIKREISRALEKAGTKETINHLVKWSKTETNMYTKEKIGSALGETGTKEAVARLIKWSKTETNERVKKKIASALGEAGTKEAVNRLIELSKTETDTYVKLKIVLALGEAGTKEAINYLLEWSKTENDTYIKEYIVLALGKAGTKETINYLLEWSKTEIDTATGRAIASRLFFDLGYSAISNVQKQILNSGSDEKEKSKQILMKIITHHVDRRFRSFNIEVDRDTESGEKQLETYLKRLRNNPDILYLILSLSQEITSHSFPIVFDYFKANLIQQYGQFDVFRYISEQDDNNFLIPFLFTMAIFGKLEECLKDSGYASKKIAELILSRKEIKSFIDNPALFSKIIINIMAFKNQELRNAFIKRLAKLAQENLYFMVFIKIMLHYGFIKDSRLNVLVKDEFLPEISPAWKGPQQNWVSKEGAIIAGLYWSTRAGSEKAHYENFPNTFKDYGYIDIMISKNVSSEIKDEYKEKLNKYGAKKVLVKKFEKTERVMEIYLYSSLNAIKESVHPITITRGHAGDTGNTDYPGIPGGLRFVSHCRSINDSDSLIKANPDNAIVTITGTGRASETNPTLKYLFEYLGSKDKWGDWQEVKNYIRPHLEQSINKYNFPNDDISFIYAAMMQKMKQGLSKPSSSGNVLEGSNISETVTIQNAIATSSAGVIGRTSSSGTKQPDSSQPEKVESTVFLSTTAAKILNPLITQEYMYVKMLGRLVKNMRSGRPSAYIIERGNIFGKTAQVIPKGLLEFFVALPKEIKTYLILDISKNEITALLKAYDLEACEHIKSCEEILGVKYTPPTTKESRATHIRALIEKTRFSKLGLGSRDVNIGVVANPITSKTEAEFNTAYHPEDILKKYGVRVTKTNLDNSKFLSLPRALQALVSAFDVKDSKYIIDIILPPMVLPQEILNAIIQYKKTLEFILQAA